MHDDRVSGAGPASGVSRRGVLRAGLVTAAGAGVGIGHWTPAANAAVRGSLPGRMTRLTGSHDATDRNVQVPDLKPSSVVPRPGRHPLLCVPALGSTSLSCSWPESRSSSVVRR